MEQSNSAGPANVPALRWVGDNLSCDPDKPATINLVDRDGHNLYLSLAETLARAKEINSYGLGRITSCASFAAERGYLCGEDAEAWRQWSGARN